MAYASSDEENFEKLSTISIQGGGAYGFSLLGQFAGLLDSQNNTIPTVIAGTSAGAIISILFWAGYGPEEILKLLSQKIDDRHLMRLIQSQKEGRSLRANQLNRIKNLSKEIQYFFSTFQGESGRFVGSRRVRRLYSYSYFFKERKFISTIFKRFSRRGLYSADNFVEWVDALLLQKINELHAKANIEPHGSGYRPTFKDFFSVDNLLSENENNIRPLLIVALANISKHDFLIVDSHSQAFESLKISDVMRASMAFPGFFTPVELSIKRDTQTGEVADEISYLNASKHASTYDSHELFIDGGIIANFPSWLVLDLAREIMWGKNLKGNNIRLPEGCSFDDAGVMPGLNDEPIRPLRNLAFRAMVHQGVQLLADKSLESTRTGNGRERSPGEHTRLSILKLRQANVYWPELGAMITGSARSKLEDRLLDAQLKITNSRYINTAMPTTKCGWPHGVLDFDKLNTQIVTSVYDIGREWGKEISRKISFSIPKQSNETSVENLSEINKNIFYHLKNSLNLLSNSENEILRNVKVYCSAFLLKGIKYEAVLEEWGRYAPHGLLPVGQQLKIEDRDGELDYPECLSYILRSAIVCRREPDWLNADVYVDENSKKSSSIRYIEPIFDVLEKRETFSELANPENWVNDISIEDARKHNYDRFSIGKPKTGVIFGVLRCEIIAENLKDYSSLAELWASILDEPKLLPVYEFSQITAAYSRHWSNKFAQFY